MEKKREGVNDPPQILSYGHVAFRNAFQNCNVNGRIKKGNEIPTTDIILMGFL